METEVLQNLIGSTKKNLDVSIELRQYTQTFGYEKVVLQMAAALPFATRTKNQQRIDSAVWTCLSGINLSFCVAKIQNFIK